MAKTLLLLSIRSPESELRIMRDKYGTWRKVGDELTMSAALPAYTIENAVERVAKWAKDVAQRLDAPDLWRISLGEGVMPGALAPDSSNTPFSPASRRVYPSN